MPRKKIKAVTDKLKESQPSYAITSRLRAIGNSKGIILPGRLIEEAGISPDADLTIQALGGTIIISEAQATGVNTDLSTWDEHFKRAKKKGKPEPGMWGGLQNEFDKEEWI